MVLMLLDVNNHSPVFPVDVYSARVDEDITADDVIVAGEDTHFASAPEAHSQRGSQNMH